MSQALVDRFVAECHVPRVAGALREAFLSGAGVRLLWITGDPAKRPEVGDLTVVLRELLSAFPGRVQIALAERGEETLYRERYEIKVLPTVLFFRDGRPMAVIPGIKRWEEYLNVVRQLLGESVEADFEVNPFLEAFMEAKRFTNF